MVTVVISLGLYLFALAWRPLLYVALALQSGYLLYRGVELGRIPLVGTHDTLNFLSASLVGFGLAIHATRRQGRAYFLMLSLLCAAFTAFALLQQPYANPLPPVLRTYWFELHVAMSFLSYALFGVGAILGVVWLRLSADPAEAVAVERLQYKTIFIGYSLFSLSMIFGGVWAWLAWGTYWLWTPKELWTSLLWIYYALYLHARLWPRLQGRPTVVLGAVGFVVVLFTYLGVGLLMKSSHAF